MHNTAILYRDSVRKRRFYKGDVRDFEAHWRRYTGTWNGALKNAIISIALKEWRMMLMRIEGKILCSLK